MMVQESGFVKATFSLVRFENLGTSENFRNRPVFILALTETLKTT